MIVKVLESIDMLVLKPLWKTLEFIQSRVQLLLSIMELFTVEKVNAKLKLKKSIR